MLGRLTQQSPQFMRGSVRLVGTLIGFEHQRRLLG